MKIRNTEIKIIQGDITTLKVDAIVNPANESLKMEAGLAGIIKKNGGQIIEEEAIEKAPVSPGDSIWTNGISTFRYRN